MSRRNATRAARAAVAACRPTEGMMVEDSRVRVLSPEAAAIRARRVQNLDPNKRKFDGKGSRNDVRRAAIGD